jgi:hypothetical protein
LIVRPDDLIEQLQFHLHVYVDLSFGSSIDLFADKLEHLVHKHPCLLLDLVGSILAPKTLLHLRQLLNQGLELLVFVRLYDGLDFIDLAGDGTRRIRNGLFHGFFGFRAVVVISQFLGNVGAEFDVRMLLGESLIMESVVAGVVVPYNVGNGLVIVQVQYLIAVLGLAISSQAQSLQKQDRHVPIHNG